MSEENHAKRVAKNTLALYFRMAFLVIVSLYTVRIVLQVLGSEDYGLNNVVGGFVGLFGFFTGTMLLAAQRYFAVNLATRDWEKLNTNFSVILFILLGFSFIVLLLAETVGLWFVTTQLVIPAERMTAAVVVYQASIVGFILMLVAAPLTALLVADENLSVYAFVSIFEGVAKLLIVYALLVVNMDKLILYALMQLGISFIVQGFYLWYCRQKYPQLHLKLCRDKEVYLGIFSYIHWNVIGAIASVLRGQGVNIIINLFFGPVVNAARGIAFQVNNVVVSFAQNFMRAVDPQIVKSYAVKNYGKFDFLLIASAKLAYYLLFIIALPLILNIHYVLDAWLGQPPENTYLFVVLALIDALLMSMTDTICTGVDAVGKVKWYQIVVGGLNLFIMPLTYIALMLCEMPWIPFVVSIVVTLIGGVLRMLTFSRIYDFNMWRYFRHVYIPIASVTILSCIICGPFFGDANNFVLLLRNSVMCAGSVVSVVYFVGLNRQERDIIMQILPIRKLLRRLRGMR